MAIAHPSSYRILVDRRKTFSGNINFYFSDTITVIKHGVPAASMKRHSHEISYTLVTWFEIQECDRFRKPDFFLKEHVYVFIYIYIFIYLFIYSFISIQP